MTPAVVLFGIDAYLPSARYAALQERPIAHVERRAQVSQEGFPVEVHRELRGAYFRKIESEPSRENKGITGVVRLPDVSFDPSRQFVNNDPGRSYQTGPLDRPSIYVGG